MHIYIYVYIYICVCVCVCVSVLWNAIKLDTSHLIQEFSQQLLNARPSQFLHTPNSQTQSTARYTETRKTYCLQPTHS